MLIVPPCVVHPAKRVRYEGGAGGDASADARNGYFTAPKYTDGPGEARVSVGGVPGKGGPKGRRSTHRMGKGEAMALRVLRRHGWVAGMGMGRHNQGRREPVLAEPHKDKRGVGWCVPACPALLPCLFASRFLCTCPRCADGLGPVARVAVCVW